MTCSWRKRQLPSNAADLVGRIAKVLTSWNGLMLADRRLVNGQPTVYVCRGFVCQAPVM